ncbi:hypothetical protein [Burkholderia pyrrocinia]|uniref:hypothetical protein n=1 Tax=Burkholderia pyrrocinia TaxID=60550 RepID=UPI001FC7E790|nr:hypothetical protein [Burkholderia pyrrocinia]
MRIDIDQLDEAELRDLNHRIVERLRFLQQMRAHTAMLKLSIGDRVSSAAMMVRKCGGAWCATTARP